MDLTEIKELYLEELALLKRIQQFGKKQQQWGNRVERVTMLLLYRIYSNLFSSLLMIATAYKKRSFSFFQLPIGIILRCAFTDCLFALYIQLVDAKRAYKELDIRAIEYANSLFERKEVYRDQVKSTSKIIDDVLIDNMWELTMEDNFLHLLSFDANNEKQVLIKQTKKQLLDAGFLNLKSTSIKEQKDFLLEHEKLKVIAVRLFHYYKYFSQYEHFSENGQGDILVSSEEDGNDNIHQPSAISALRDGVEEVMRMKLSRNAC